MKYILLLTISLFFVGCSKPANEMAKKIIDGETGQEKVINYSKYYTCGDWIIDNKVSVILVAEHHKEINPFFSKIKYVIGALGKEDLKARAKLTINPRNFGEEPVELTVVKIVGPGGNVVQVNKTFSLAPEFADSYEAGMFDIINYSTALELSVYFEINNNGINRDFILKRLTFEDLQKPPDYPWVEE